MDEHKILLIFFLIVIAIVISFPVLVSLRLITIGPSLNLVSTSVSCTSGDTQNCLFNSCLGVSTCVNGVWSGCNSQRVCSPGNKVPCVVNGCANSFKQCNACGTAYGPCLAGSP